MEMLLSHSATQTQKFAAKFAATLKSGDIIILKGDLGTGKTTFTQGLGQFFKIEKHITSPTFIGMQLYEISNHLDIHTLCHIDAYRFKSIDDAISAGLADYVGKEGIVTIIEWPEQLFGLFNQPHQIIKLSHIDENTRKIKIIGMSS